MSVLPRTVPAKFAQQLHDALTAAGVGAPTPKPGYRLSFLVAHLGRDWTVQYVLNHGGEPLWKLTGEGPDYEWGPSAFTADVVAAVTAPVTQPEPEPVDPHPGVPRTHLGFDVPDFIRAHWDSPQAEGFRLGLAAAVGKLPANRTR